MNEINSNDFLIAKIDKPEQELAKLKETIKAKDAEIEKLKSDYYYRQYLGSQTIKDENKRIYSLLGQKDKAIAEAREIIASSYGFIEDGDFFQDQRKVLCEKAKAWLESNK